MDVQIGGRLVDEKQTRFLCERACEGSALVFAAGKLTHGVIPEPGKLEGVERPFHHFTVVWSCRSPESEKGGSAELNRLLHRVELRHRCVLGHQGNRAGQAAPAPFG